METFRFGIVGDYYPSTAGTKIFAIFFLPISTLLLAKIVSDYTSVRPSSLSK